MFKYTAKVVGLDPDIEEEVTLRIKGMDFTCFAGICPYELSVGQEYPVTFEMLDFELSEQVNSDETSFERIENTYAYTLKGKLCRDTIDVGIKISDEFLASDYAYLDGKYICLNVDRLDVEFLEN